MLNALVLDKETIKIVNVLMFYEYPMLTNSWNSSQKHKEQNRMVGMIGKRTKNDPTEGQF